MATYIVKVTVDYEFEVEADSEDEAEAEGWKYQNYAQFGTVDGIDVEQLDDDDEDEEENF
tara:strand:+ start:242 stop:421 length:180 start_codon:yes stop_codon:yes gene_type:complete